MRIGQFSDSFLPIVDGVGRVVLSYANGLCEKGHEVYVVAPMSDVGYRGKYPFEIIDYAGMAVPKLPQYRAGMPLFDSHYHSRLGVKQFDIVHVHSPFTAGSEGVRIAKRHDVPVVGSFHSKYYDDFLQYMKLAPLADAGVPLVVDFYERCDEVWAVSQASAATLQDYGYSREVRVMPNGMEACAVSDERTDAVAREYSTDGLPVLLFVGQLNWKKNIDLVIEAAALMHDNGAKFRLFFAGQGPHEKEIREKVSALRLDGQVKFLGHITDTETLYSLYKLSSLFVFPSLYDNAPMVLREAAAMGTPSVVIPGSSSAEVITEGENGYCCENDPEDLYKTITEALDNPKALAKAGENAKDSIPVPWSYILEDVVVQYEKLISARKSRLIR